jgi:hypothetical protein
MDFNKINCDGISVFNQNHLHFQRRAAEQLDPPNRLGREWSQGGFAKQRNLDEMNVQP